MATRGSSLLHLPFLPPSLPQEIFGPVLTVFVYPDGEWEDMLKLVGILAARHSPPETAQTRPDACAAAAAAAAYIYSEDALYCSR